MGTMILSDFLSILQSLLGILLIVCLVWYVQFHWKQRHIYKLISNIPGPKTLPFIGNAYQFIGTPTHIFETLMNMFDQNFPILKIWLTPTFYFIGIQKPEYLEIVLNSPHCIDKADYFFKFMKPVLGEGLFNAPENKWKKNRKIIRPAFNQNILDSFVPIFVKCSKTMCDVIQQHVKEINMDLYSLIGPSNLDVICETAMGIQVNAKDNETTFGEKLDGNFKIIWLRMFIIFLQYDFIFNLTWLSTQFKEYSDYIKNFTMNIVVQKRIKFQERQKLLNSLSEQKLKEDDIAESKKSRIFLDHLLELTKENKFTDVELMDEVMIFTVAGSDTVATTICFALTMLGMHPKIQQKVYEEIIDTVGHDRPITPEDMHKLKYTERFIKETLRLFPPAPILARDVKENVKLDEEYTLPGGSTVLFIPINIQRSERYWKDPLKFDPDRFLLEEIAKRHPYCYLPFSAGPRNCIGIKFAMMSLKTTLSILLRRFVVKTSYKSVEEIVLQNIILLRPTYGFKVMFEERV